MHRRRGCSLDGQRQFEASRVALVQAHQWRVLVPCQVQAGQPSLDAGRDGRFAWPVEAGTAGGKKQRQHLVANGLLALCHAPTAQVVIEKQPAQCASLRGCAQTLGLALDSSLARSAGLQEQQFSRKRRGEAGQQLTHGGIEQRRQPAQRDGRAVDGVDLRHDGAVGKQVQCKHPHGMKGRELRLQVGQSVGR